MIISLLENQLLFLTGMVFRADERIYWGYLLSSIVLALGVLIKQQASDVAVTWQSRPIKALKTILDPKVYWHPSARLDYKIMAVNSLVRGSFASVSTSLGLGLAVLLHWLLTYLYPLENQIGFLQGTLMFWYTLCLFLAHDFSRFLLHTLQHHISWLWRFHSVHHSAEVLTPVTLYRVHPLDVLLFNLRHALTLGLVIGIFSYITKGQLTLMSIFGVEAFGFLFNLLGANLRHSHIWIGFGWLESYFISPAQHQLHHSRAPKHFNCNFGSCLAIWDRLAGSLRLSSMESSNPSYGIDGLTHKTLGEALMKPFKGV